MNVYRLSRRHALSTPLIAAIGACALWIVYMSSWGERAPLADLQLAARGVKLEEIRLAPDYPPPGPGPDLAETTARPLFNASRRPPQGAAQAGAASTSSLPRGRYTLTGVSIASGERVALLYDGATNKTVRVEQNKELGGMLVEAVTENKVTLKLGDEREDIALSVAPAPKVAAAVPAVPDQASGSGQAGAPPATKPQPLPLVSTLPAAAAAPGVAQSAADIANADPITAADVAERAARVQARRNRQAGERTQR